MQVKKIIAPVLSALLAACIGQSAASTWVPISNGGLTFFIPDPTIENLVVPAFSSSSGSVSINVGDPSSNQAYYYRSFNVDNNSYGAWQCTEASVVSSNDNQLVLNDLSSGNFQYEVSACMTGNGCDVNAYSQGNLACSETMNTASIEVKNTSGTRTAAASSTLSDYVGYTAGQFRVSESGAATYSVPINVPVGTAGVQPQVSLNYSSQGGEGLLGIGWSLSASSAITRCPKDFVHDSEISGVSYTKSDRLCLDGQRLILNGREEQTPQNDNDSIYADVTNNSYWATSAVYHTEIDSGSVIKPNYVNSVLKGFTVENKAGEIHYYGITARNNDEAKSLTGRSLNYTFEREGTNDTGADAFHGVAPNSNTAKFWALKAVRDIKDNYILYKYENDEANGEHYLSDIYYTGNTAVSPKLVTYAKINFDYSNNKKARNGWLAGYAWQQTKLLNEIKVTIDNEEYRTYTLEYFESNFQEEKNYLETITECIGSDCLKPLNFAWQKRPEINSTTQSYTYNYGGESFTIETPITDPFVPFSTSSVGLGSAANNSKSKIFDINGDGIADVVYVDGNEWKVKYGGSFNGTAKTLTTGLTGKAEYALIFDYNGDGVLDLLAANGTSSNWYVLSFNIEQSDTLCLWQNGCKTYYSSPKDKVDTGVKAIGLEGKTQLLDIDGDSLVDIVQVSGNKLVYNRNNGDGTFSSEKTLLDFSSNGDEISRFDQSSIKYSASLKNSSAFDVNGDGRSDLLFRVTETEGYCTDEVFVNEFDCIREGRELGHEWIETSTYHWKVYIASGQESLTELQTIKSTTASSFDLDPRIADLNGDGLSDIMFIQYGKWYYRLSDGTSFLPEKKMQAINQQGNIVDVNAGDYDKDHSLIVDVNSDGRTDVLLPTSSGSAWISYFSLPVVGSPEEILFQMRGSYSFDRNSIRQFADLNGDGYLDYLKASGNSWNVYYGGLTNQAQNVIKTITNGFGIQTTVNYTNITNSDVYFEQDSSNRFDENGNELTYLFSPKSAYYVVSKAESDTNNGTSANSKFKNSVSYQYAGLLIHKKGRGMLGFEKVRSIDNQSCLEDVEVVPIHDGNDVEIITTYYDCIITETTYAQEFPFIGMPLETKQTIGESSNYLSRAINQLDYKKTVDKGFFPYINGSTEYTYASNNALTTTTNIGVTESTFTYDSYGNLDTSLIVQRHPTSTAKFSSTYVDNAYGTTDQYKRLGRLTSSQVEKKFEDNSQTSSNGTTNVSSSFSYYSGSLLLKTSDDGLLNTTYEYDDFGNKSGVTVVGNVDANNSVSQTRTSTTEYSKRGRFAISNTNVLGHKTTMLYYGKAGTTDKPTGRLTQVDTISPNNTTSKVYFDKFGTKTRETVTGATQSDPTLETKYYHSYCSSISTTGCSNSNAYYRTIVASSGAPESQVFYDAWGREVSTRVRNFKNDWTVTQKAYDQNGRLEFNYEPENVGATATSDTYSTYYTKYTYDRMGRVKKEDRPTGYTNYSYSAGTTVQQVTATDQSKYRHIEQVDWTGKTSRVYSKHNTTVTGRLDYKYTVGLNLHKVKVYTDGGTYSHTQVTNTYDKYGRKETTDDENKGQWTYTYNDFGELVEQENSEAQVTTFAFDKLGRKTTRLDDDGYTSWTYDDASVNYSKGKLTKVALYKGKTNATGSPDYSEAYTFTSFGKTESTSYSIDSESFKTEFYYDEFNRVRYTRYPSNNFTIKHTYTSLGFPDKIINATTGHRDEGVEYQKIDSMNARGQVTQLTFGNGVSETKDYYDENGWLSYIGIAKGNNTALHSLSYTYHDTGNLKTRTNDFSVSSSAYDTVETFEYDDLNRVEKRIANLAGGTTTQSYTYDRLGNIKTKDGLTFNYSSDVKNELKTITGAKNYSFNYDNKGNVLSDSHRTFIYSSFDLPTRIVKGSTAVDFSYGANRQLYRQTQTDPNGVTDILKVAGMYERTSLPSGVIEHKYMVGNTVVTDRSNNVNDTLYLHTDNLGSTVSITNHSGTIQQHFMYDPWGKQSAFYDNNRFASYTSPAESQGYTGHKMLNDIGIIHMNGRIYDPTLGRFLQADPHIQAPKNSQNYNRYSYVLNNPMSYTDPSGYFFKKLFKAIGKSKWLTTAISIGLFFVPGCQTGACSAAFNAAVTYAVTGSLKAAAIGAFVSSISPNGFSPTAFLGRGVIGGLASRVQGGNFGHGFIAAGASGAAGGIGDVPLRILASAVIGGTVSKITGGKFANGATSAAFATLVTSALNGDFKTKKYHALSQKRGPYENESEMGVAADNPEAVFNEAMSALDGNPYVRDLDAISFEDKMAIGIMDDSGGLSSWKTFDTFEEANNFASINPETKTWLGGVSNGETAVVFRNATYAKPNFRFHNRSFIPVSLTHVENAARVIVHEGMHNRGVPHNFRLYNAEYMAVQGVRKGKW